MRKKKGMPTLWEIPDELWERIEPLIDELDPPKETGRPREDGRRIWLFDISRERAHM